MRVFTYDSYLIDSVGGLLRPHVHASSPECVTLGDTRMAARWVTYKEDAIMRHTFGFFIAMRGLILTLRTLLQIANDLLQSSSCSSRENGFEERFKYDIISSSLLSSSLAAPTTTHRPSLMPEIPGKLDDGGGSTRDPHSSSGSAPDSISPDSPTSSASNAAGLEFPIALLSIAAAFLSAGFSFLAIVSLGAAIYVRYVVQADHSTPDSMSQVSDLSTSSKLAWQMLMACRPFMH